MVRSAVDVRALQAPLRERYQADPDVARIELVATSGASDLSDPLHCAVELPASGGTIAAGAHPLVGGVGDVPCSGDLLLAALAACQETTLRMVAANMGVDLVSVDVRVTGDWDARGTLALKGAPIGITHIRCDTRVVVAGDERGERADRLLRSAEKYCVILDTLRSGVSVESTFSLEQGTT
ncbi:MAG TPA: OsmC family protein [Candidatus Limnocylindria bacterium]